MAKPFSIQSPEDIAKEYAGNKQKIAQAMQMGIVDPTAGVLAGMFIDRMRAAQMQEGMPQATVAQQVMGGAPPVPAPPLPAGGLGAPAQAAPPMTPPMGMAPPMPMPEAPPMGMADGGLAMLPVPDAMFDEPDVGGYAGGGIVAFGPGGEVSNALSWMDAPVTSPYGVSRSTGAHQGIDYGVKDRTPIGSIAPGVVKRAGFDKINGNYVVVEHPNGKSTSYSHLAELRVKEGQPLEAGQLVGLSGNTGRVRGKGGGYHLHLGARDEKGNRIDPGSVLEDLENLATRSMPERDLSTAEGQSQSFGDIFRMFQSQYGPTEEEKAVDARVMARAEEMASPEFYEKQRKASMWETLAEIGFNMASSKSPFLLQAVGEAAAAAMPGAKVARKEREQLKDRALDAMQAMNGLRRKENRELLGLTFDAYKTRLSQEQFEETMDLKRDELAQVRELALEELDAKTQAAVASATGGKTTELDRIARMYFETFKLRQRQDKYVHDKPTSAPGSKIADQELMLRAYREAAKTLGKSGDESSLFDPSTPSAGGGGASAGGENVVDFSQLK